MHPITIWRSQTKISQGDLAERLGVSRVTINRWECGATMPSKVNTIVLASLMDTDANELHKQFQEIVERENNE